MRFINEFLALPFGMAVMARRKAVSQSVYPKLLQMQSKMVRPLEITKQKTKTTVLNMESRDARGEDLLTCV